MSISGDRNKFTKNIVILYHKVCKFRLQLLKYFIQLILNIYFFASSNNFKHSSIFLILDEIVQER